MQRLVSVPIKKPWWFIFSVRHFRRGTFSSLLALLFSYHLLPTILQGRTTKGSFVLVTERAPLFTASSFFPLYSLILCQLSAASTNTFVLFHRSQEFEFTASPPPKLQIRSSNTYTCLTIIHKMSSPVKARAANAAADTNEIDVYSASHVYYGPNAHHKQHNHFRTRTYSTVSCNPCLLAFFPQRF